MTTTAVEAEAAVVAAAKYKIDLDRALGFKSQEIVYRLQKDFDVSLEAAEKIFLETKRWLWACAVRMQDVQASDQKVPLNLIITPELEAIDRGWHCFLLFTKEYKHFCEEYLGTFVHHIPLTVAEVESFEKIRTVEPRRALEIRKNELRPQLDYLYDLIGPTSLKCWYQELPLLIEKR